ncbi:hypothetical protein [Blautia difficilis]|uniref:hypothetical protein n=1 Tax=Blautia difficilis TaxID=2763027 RepID=UPI001FACE36E|nr:hypothetical protein [Blautia difficilis]
MKGSHKIIVESRKVKYDFVIHRNITIITGDSGSGKTVLIDLIYSMMESVQKKIQKKTWVF